MSLKHVKPWVLAFLLFLYFATGCAPSENEAFPTSSTPTPTEATTQVFSSPTPTATEEKLQGTLTIWHSWDENDMPVLEEILRNFSQKYPDILLDVLYVPQVNLLRRFELDAPAGKGAILFFGPGEWGDTLYNSALITPLEQLISQETLDRLNQPALQSAYRGNRLLSAPYAIHGVVLYRNREYMTLQAKTLDELVQFAQAATTEEFHGAILERSFLYSGAHLMGLGGQWMDDSGLPHFLGDQALAWIELLRTFEMAGATSFLSDEDLELFKMGKVGWIIDGTWNLNTLVSELGAEKLAIDPWPATKQGSLSGFVFSENVYISRMATLQQIRLAMAFLEYFLSPEAQTILTSSHKIPASSGITITDPIYGSLISQAMIALAGGSPAPPEHIFEIYQVQLNIALKAIFEEGQDPNEALLSAASAIQLQMQTSSNPTTPTP